MYGIVGASGTLGSRVAERFLARGESTRLFSRQPSRLAHLAAAGRGDVVRADLREDDGWDAALAGVETLVLAAHGLVPPVRDNNPNLTDDRGQRRVIDAARRAGVRRIVFVSAAAADPASRVRFLRIKGRVEEHLKRSGSDHLIVRPTVFAETHALILLAEPLIASGKVRIMGPGQAPVNWVSAADVADLIVAEPASGGNGGSVMTIGGPDTLSRVQVLERIEARLGRRATRRHVPLPLLRLIGASAGRLNPALRCLVELTVEEQAGTGETASAPARLDRIGPTTIDEVIDRWATGRGAGPPAAVETAARKEGP